MNRVTSNPPIPVRGVRRAIDLSRQSLANHPTQATEGPAVTAICSLKSSGCRYRSILILAATALHPSGISCN